MVKPKQTWEVKIGVADSNYVFNTYTVIASSITQAIDRVKILAKDEFREDKNIEVISAEVHRLIH